MSYQQALPKNLATWRAESQLLSVKSIHQHGLACSGSSISREQFLLLRTIWVERSVHDLYTNDRALWIDNFSFQSAQQFLSSKAIQPSWQRFLKSVTVSQGTLEQQGYADLHTFSLVRYHQTQSQGLDPGDNDSAKVDMSPIARRTRQGLIQRASVQSSPTPGPRHTGLESPVTTLHISDSPPRIPTTPPQRSSIHTPGRSSSSGSSGTSQDISSPFEDPRLFKAIQDEQIVNTALIEYLNALAIHCTQLKANWTLHRIPLIAHDRQRVKTYEARVDGYLKRRRDEKPLAIIEVKPFARSQKKQAIRMQESAQMAAWINQYRPDMSKLSDKKQKMSRLLISQDRHQIYLNFASFNADYVDYICDKQGIDLDAVSLLQMNEYGPFDVGIQSDMSQLGELVLGYALQQCSKHL
ncbi:hypothetical protein F5Y09DRAFT_309437 [Xylaria sp. FL1042]|nr:hypothetical protein F5Y09DRAFT_309437 [Xylaria sp. FL1042]